MKNPPLDCTHEEFLAFHESLKFGERVVERGQSCMTGETGTIVKTNRGSGKGVKWDTEFADHPGARMTTSVTGGTRRLEDEDEA